LDRKEYDDLISAIGKRVFLLRNVHDKQPGLFQTRWAMNYLAGPVTRLQIPALNALAGVEEQGSRGAGEQSPVSRPPSPTPVSASVVSPQPSTTDLPGTTSRPAVPGQTAEYFLPNNLTVSQAALEDGRSLSTSAKPLGLLYRPVLLAQAGVKFLNRKYNLDYEVKKTAVVIEPDRRGTVRWENHLTQTLDSRDLDQNPAPEARFINLEEPLSDAKVVKTMETDFIDWIYRGTEAMVKANETLAVFAGPNEAEEEFEKACQKAAAEKAEVEADKIEAQFEKKIDALETKLSREERELAEDEADYKQRKMEEAATHAETLFSLFSKRRRSVSSSMTKRRMTAKSREDVEESKEEIEQLKQDIDELEADMKEALDELEAKWAEIAADITEIPVTPYKKDVSVALFGVAWMPYHLVEDGGQMVEIVGFAMGD
jgi:phage shock protein A